MVPLALFLAVLLDVGLQRLLGMTAGVNGMAGCGLGMVRGLLMVARLVMFGGFAVVAGCMGQVLRGFLVVLCSLLRHEFSPRGCDHTTQEIVATFLGHGSWTKYT